MRSRAMSAYTAALVRPVNRGSIAGGRMIKGPPEWARQFLREASVLGDDGVAQDADPRDFHFDSVAGLHP